MEATRVGRCGTTEAIGMEEGRVRSPFFACGLAAARSWELVGRYVYGRPNCWLILGLSRLGARSSQVMHRNAREMRSCGTFLPISQL